MENTSLEEKVKNLEVELSQARTQIERMYSTKLDEVLNAQKPSSDKIVLGYVVSSGTSSSTASGSKIVFVPQYEKGDKFMKSKTDLATSKSFVRLTLGLLVLQKLLMFVTIVVFLDTFILIVSSCILISKCLNDYMSLSRFNTFVWRVIKIFELFNSISREF